MESLIIYKTVKYLFVGATSILLLIMINLGSDMEFSYLSSLSALTLFLLWAGVVLSRYSPQEISNAFVKCYKILATRKINENNLKVLNDIYDVCAGYYGSDKKDLKIEDEFLSYCNSKIWDSEFDNEKLNLLLLNRAQNLHEQSLKDALVLKKLGIYLLYSALALTVFSIGLYFFKIYSIGEYSLESKFVLQLAFSGSFVSILCACGLFFPLSDYILKRGNKEHYRNNLIILSTALIKEHVSPNKLYEEVEIYFQHLSAA